MTENDGYSEKRLLAMMRKTLTNIARETAPTERQNSALSENTIHDIRDCLAVISTRERELANNTGKSSKFKPVFQDDNNRSSQTVKLTPSPKKTMS